MSGRRRMNAVERSIRVAYFNGTLKPGHDGVTRVLYRLMEALKDRDIENIFFSAILPEPAERSVQMHLVPSVAFPLYKEYRFAVPGQRHFEERLRAFKPDLLHIHSPCSLGHSAVKFARRHKIPVVATYHTHFASYAKYYKIRALERMTWNYLRNLYNDCDLVYVPSHPILNELRMRDIRNLEFLPHGVDTTVFNPHFRSHQWKIQHGLRGKSVLLYAGRLVWEKDLRTLAEAYRILNTKRTDAVFALAGDGPIRNELRQMMPEASFLGHLSGEELSTAYASSDIFVFPSTTETFGNVTVEAMASGLVPICAREGGAYGIVEHGITGFHAAPRDPHDLVRHIEFLLDNPEKRAEMADQALRFTRHQSWEKVFNSMFAGYDDVIRAHAQKSARERSAA